MQDIAIVTMKANRNSYAIYQMVPFPRPWTNPNPVFKVTPLFDGKYLTNGYRYGHSYYRRRIGNRTQAFEWHRFQWPRVISNPDFKVTTFNVKKLGKWYKIELYLQWTTNRKSHVVYRTAPFSIFNDLERPLTWFSRSRHSLTQNISEMATDTATVAIEGE